MRCSSQLLLKQCSLAHSLLYILNPSTSSQLYVHIPVSNKLKPASHEMFHTLHTLLVLYNFQASNARQHQHSPSSFCLWEISWGFQVFGQPKLDRFFLRWACSPYQMPRQSFQQLLRYNTQNGNHLMAQTSGELQDVTRTLQCLHENLMKSRWTDQLKTSHLLFEVSLFTWLFPWISDPRWENMGLCVSSRRQIIWKKHTLLAYDDNSRNLKTGNIISDGPSSKAAQFTSNPCVLNTESQPLSTEPP